VDPNFAFQHFEILSEAIVRGIKKGEFKERILSSQLASLLGITLISRSKELFLQVSGVLRRLIFSLKKTENDFNDKVISSLIDTFVCLNILSHYGEEIWLKNGIEVLSHIFSPLETDKADFGPLSILSSLRGFSAFVSLLPTDLFYDEIFPDYFASITDFLHSENLEIRIAAGYAVALFVEKVQDKEQEDFSLYSLQGYVDVEDLLATLSSLQTDKKKERSKQEKLKQRYPFKRIVSFLEEGRTPKETLVFNTQKVCFETWGDIILLDSFRNILKEGFDIHFSNNVDLQHFFGIETESAPEKFELPGKRLFIGSNSLTSKARSKEMKKQVSIKALKTTFEEEEA